MRYKTLNDCALYLFPTRQPGLPYVQVWYAKQMPGFDLDAEEMTKLKSLTAEGKPLTDTHTLVGEFAVPMRGGFVTDADLDAIYSNLQGEVWSPQGEARDLIKSLGLHHTSMSVGDILWFSNGEVAVVSGLGWQRVPAGVLPPLGVPA